MELIASPFVTGHVIRLFVPYASRIGTVLAQEFGRACNFATLRTEDPRIKNTAYKLGEIVTPVVLFLHHNTHCPLSLKNRSNNDI